MRRDVYEAMAARGVDIKAVRAEFERQKRDVPEMLALVNKIHDATLRQWEEERRLFGDLDALARRIRRLHAPIVAPDTTIDVAKGMPTADTPSLFAVADAIDAAVKRRRNRVPWKPRRGAKGRGMANAVRILMDLGATKREADTLLAQARRRRRQARRNLGK